MATEGPQRSGSDVRGPQGHRHVDQRLDRGRMIAHPTQRRGTIVAAEHRRDRGQLQLRRDGAHRAARRIDELDRQIDRGEEPDARHTTRDLRQQAPQRGRGGARRDDNHDLTESIVALQLGDCSGGTNGDVAAGSHPTNGHLALAVARDWRTRNGLRTHGDHLDGCIVPDRCHTVAWANTANAARTEQVITPSSSTTAASHGGRTTAATAIGSSSPEDSTAMRTNRVA